jgi:hypothetical protein
MSFEPSHLKMIRILLCFGVVMFSLAGVARADETVRQIQEELRKRNLYFGNTDGQSTPEVIGALKRYQKRKGFAVTGALDPDTAASLHVQSALVSPQGTTAVSSVQATAAPTERDPSEWADLPVVPEPPAEAPPSQEISPDRVNKFVEAYLRDAETDDIFLQTWFYAFPVEYFQYGAKDQKFVIKDTHNYVKAWPERKYTLLASPSLVPAENEREANVEFSIEYQLRNKKHATSGKAKYFWRVRIEGDDLKIVAIREQLIPNKK